MPKEQKPLSKAELKKMVKENFERNRQEDERDVQDAEKRLKDEIENPEK